MRITPMRRTMRYIRCLATPLLLLIGPAPLGAHDGAFAGAHAPDMSARVVSAVQQGNRVAITFELTGLGGPLVLVGVSTPGAITAPMDPVYVNFAQDVMVTTHAAFAGQPPLSFHPVAGFRPHRHRGG